MRMPNDGRARAPNERETWINIRATVKRGRDNIYVTPFSSRRLILDADNAFFLAARVAVVVFHRATRRRQETRLCLFLRAKVVGISIVRFMLFIRNRIYVLVRFAPTAASLRICLQRRRRGAS